MSDKKTLVRFVRASAAEEPGISLLRGMHEEMARVLGVDQNAVGMPSASPADFASPTGAFLVGWSADHAVCCGGIKRLDQSACEIKRMYVIPEARGRGAAGLLLRALEQEARRLGYAVVRLDSGSALTSAIRLYKSAGYIEIENFNNDPVADYFAEKRLGEWPSGSA